MDVLRHARGHLKGAITRLHNFSLNLPAEVDPAVLEIRLERLNDTWKEFEKNQSELYQFHADEDYGDPNVDFEVFELKYMAAKSALVKALRNQLPARDEASSNASEKLAKQQSDFIEELGKTFPLCSAGSAKGKILSDVELPTIKIPPFHGDYRDWPGFRDMFLGTIGDNAKLTASQKFRYLKSFLRDEAAKLLNHLAVSDSNYDQAWEKLERRYDKPLYIVNAYIESYLKLPHVSMADHNHLRKLVDSADEVIRGLAALKCNDRDPWLVYLLLQKTDVETRQAWALESQNFETSTIQKLLDFLEVRCNALEASDPKTNVKRYNRPNSNVKSLAVVKTSCPNCKGGHLLPQCAEFLAMPIMSRRRFVRDNRLCYNCLGIKHTSVQCRAKVHCSHCNNRHHSLVHLDSNPRTIDDSAISSVDAKIHADSSIPLVSNHTCNGTRPSGILPTMVVRIFDANGNSVYARVLVDTGSQVSFVTESLVKKLALRRSHARLPISGISSLEAGVTRGVVTLALHSRFDANVIEIQTYILGKITSPIPSIPFNSDSLAFLRDVNMADSQLGTSGPIDILLGADKAWGILLNGHRTGEKEHLVAHETLFGWIISGCMPEHKVVCLNASFDIDILLKSFWEIEEVSRKDVSESDEDVVDSHFTKTLIRTPDERYMVELPFRHSNIKFANTLSGALSRLYAMERRFARNHHLHQEYIHFMNTYLNLGHMECIPEELIEPTSGEVFYLPHHAVVTNKIRVVFDGSHKDVNGVSLNEMLHIGKPLQRNLFDVCLRFRLHRYVFSADIIKMFRQIWMNPKHRDYQRVVWRDSIHKPVSHFRLCTVTYGTSPAPFLSMKVLRQLAADYKYQFPLASQIVLNDMYVDDILTGRDTLVETLDLKSQLISLLSRGGFELSKWSSNCRDVLIGTEEKQPNSLDLDSSASWTKVLGLIWDPQGDVFTFKITLSDQVSSTKRNLLSEISRIYDPIGFLAPCTILFKILFQDLWLDKNKIMWDDPLPPPVATKWISYRNQLLHLAELRIARRCTLNSQRFELIGFCDASEKAYSAVVYCRSIQDDNGYNIELIAAKTRVAPVKQLTIPRLELCGALLLCRLIALIKASLTNKHVEIIAFCDSQIVLSWLSSSPRRWNTFVANRTSEILGILPHSIWHHIRSEENPADCASRGIEPKKLIECNLWWKGPSWLQLDSCQWPIHHAVELDDNQEELKRTAVVNLVTPARHFLEDLALKISSWVRLLRIVAYTIRFSRNCQRVKAGRSYSYLSLAEIHLAKQFCLKWAQREFDIEIKAIKAAKSIPMSSKLCSLSPFLDDAGLLRVGGRLANATDIPYNMKHPIILPKRHPFALHIILDAHKRNHHVGVSGLFAIIRQEYWIIGSRNLIRKIVHDCVVCFRLRQTSTSQLMGNLPLSRLEPSFAFNRTGCDYAGPITLRLRRGTKPIFVKGYIALFICLATKAMHLELVSDLTTEAFLAALKRFIARRGKCSVIYSDNGSNFQGAARVLSDMCKLVQSEEYHVKVAEALATECIKLEFIPPYSPHFGGLWESGVRLVKQHLRRVVGNNILTFEEMYTLLTQIESLLNSRPLCALSDSDLNPLTPSHFLIGRPSTAICEPSYLEVPLNRLGRWELVQNMMQGFWRRWHTDYLTSLQQRPKWQHVNKNLQVGDLVVIKEPNSTPFQWILGRVQEVHPGPDGHVRVVTLRTSRGIFKRSITKLAVLPCS